MQDNTINNDRTMSGATGTLLAGRYRVVRQLGQGGMGSVWLAEDMKLDGFKVAIKMLPSVLVNNKRAYAQVKAEALVSLKLSHSNIVAVRAFEEEGGTPFLVMDYIDGQTLDDYLAEKGKLTEDETVKLLKPVAAALDYAHTQGVVHRDVKPGNVMIRKDGTPFVLDFGIAREIQETMTRVTGKLSSGTLLYMSPEQLNGDAPKPAQDIYSFAAMVYECLKGEPPFSRGGVEDQIKHKLPDALGEHIAICSQVMAGLAKSPEGRPRCCAAVLEKGGRKAAKTGAGASASKMRIAVVGALLARAALVGVGGWFGWSAYCRAEENRLATIKAEMGRKAAWRRLELEADRLASQVNEAQRVSAREQFARREGLGAKAKELEDAAKSGQLAFSATNLVAATNWFHVALSCSDWLSSNVVLHAQCMQVAKEALKARKAADEADAKNLASNEYGQAETLFAQAEKSFLSVSFANATVEWKASKEAFDASVRAAEKEKSRRAQAERKQRQEAEREKQLREAQEAAQAAAAAAAAAKKAIEDAKAEAAKKQAELENFNRQREAIARELKAKQDEEQERAKRVQERRTKNPLIGRWKSRGTSASETLMDGKPYYSVKEVSSSVWEFFANGTYEEKSESTSRSRLTYNGETKDSDGTSTTVLSGRWTVDGDNNLFINDRRLTMFIMVGGKRVKDTRALDSPYDHMRYKIIWRGTDKFVLRDVEGVKVAGNVNVRNKKSYYEEDGRYHWSYEYDSPGFLWGKTIVTCSGESTSDEYTRMKEYPCGR